MYFMSTTRTEESGTRKHNRPAAVFCLECGKKALRVKAEGYNTVTDEHETIILGTFCKKCGTVVVNPDKTVVDYQKILVPTNALVEPIPMVQK